ncbi:MAG: hypothetical protein ILP12_07360 [Lachnospiraceae bacterium]|nr:hypothetical protein [Lachnospiraceae bacterium]
MKRILRTVTAIVTAFVLTGGGLLRVCAFPGALAPLEEGSAAIPGAFEVVADRDGVLAEFEILADSVIIAHPNPDKIGVKDDRMLDSITDIPVIQLLSYERMRMSNLRADALYPSASVAEKDELLSYSGLRYSVNAEAVNYFLNAGGEPGEDLKTADYLKDLGASQLFAQALREALKNTASSLRERYDRTNQNNYSVMSVLSVRCNEEARTRLAAAGDVSLRVLCQATGLKQQRSVYAVYMKNGQAQKVVSALIGGINTIEFIMDARDLGTYMVLTENSSYEELKCSYHYLLAGVWLAAILLGLWWNPSRRLWIWLALAGLTAVSLIASVFAILLPQCYIELYVTGVGFFAAYVIFRMQGEQAQYEY